MPVIDTLKRLFISHSSTDKGFVDRLVADLRRQGVELWVYLECLTPGTADWEAAGHNAIDQSFALLFVGFTCLAAVSLLPKRSTTRRSEEDPDIRRLGRGRTVDRRRSDEPGVCAISRFTGGENYEEGVKVFVGELDRVRMTVPPHFLYRDYYRWFEDLRTLRFEGRGVASTHHDGNRTSYLGRKTLPDGFCIINLAPRSAFPCDAETSDVVAVSLWRSIPLTNLSTKSIWDTCANCTRLSLMV